MPHPRTALSLRDERISFGSDAERRQPAPRRTDRMNRTGRARWHRVVRRPIDRSAANGIPRELIARTNTLTRLSAPSSCGLLLHPGTGWMANACQVFCVYEFPRVSGESSSQWPRYPQTCRFPGRHQAETLECGYIPRISAQLERLLALRCPGFDWTCTALHTGKHQVCVSWPAPLRTHDRRPRRCGLYLPLLCDS